MGATSRGARKKRLSRARKEQRRISNGHGHLNHKTFEIPTNLPKHLIYAYQQTQISCSTTLEERQYTSELTSDYMPLTEQNPPNCGFWRATGNCALKTKFFPATQTRCYRREIKATDECIVHQLRFDLKKFNGSLLNLIQQHCQDVKARKPEATQRLEELWYMVNLVSSSNSSLQEEIDIYNAMLQDLSQTPKGQEIARKYQ